VTKLSLDEILLRNRFVILSEANDPLLFRMSAAINACAILAWWLLRLAQDDTFAVSGIGQASPRCNYDGLMVVGGAVVMGQGFPGLLILDFAPPVLRV
jgi:hypothetical protein